VRQLNSGLKKQLADLAKIPMSAVEALPDVNDCAELKVDLKKHFPEETPDVALAKLHELMNNLMRIAGRSSVNKQHGLLYLLAR
jgi:hypothetical protein